MRERERVRRKESLRVEHRIRSYMHVIYISTTHTGNSHCEWFTVTCVLSSTAIHCSMCQCIVYGIMYCVLAWCGCACIFTVRMRSVRERKVGASLRIDLCMLSLYTVWGCFNQFRISSFRGTALTISIVGVCAYRITHFKQKSILYTQTITDLVQYQFRWCVLATVSQKCYFSWVRFSAFYLVFKLFVFKACDAIGKLKLKFIFNPFKIQIVSFFFEMWKCAK